MFLISVVEPIDLYTKRYVECPFLLNSTKCAYKFKSQNIYPGNILLTIFETLFQVNRAFSFNKTPTGSRLKRAMSSMISPIAPRGPYHHQHMASVSGSTPSGDLQNLRLASCASLYNSSSIHTLQNTGQNEIPTSASASTTNLLAPSESPKSSRGILSRMRHHQSTSMMPPPSMPLTSYIGNGTPKRGMTSMVASSPNGDHFGSCDEAQNKKQSNDSGENGFTLPKTPTLTNKCSRKPSFKFKSSAFIGSKNK